ncbi:MAG TPA: hypothetical protein VFX48_08750 [Saprospiraceae bacterium]|nr:hypothetical protein [Saprospiraceae bacterium]
MKTNMTKVVLTGMFQFAFLAFILGSNAWPFNWLGFYKASELTFAENKCQVNDYSGRINKRVLFLAQADNVKYMFRKDGITMQVSRPGAWFESENTVDSPYTGTVRKVDLFWEGANKSAEVYGAEELNIQVLKLQGATPLKDCQIRNYRKLYYTEIYPGIDLLYCDRDNRLKYDFQIRPEFDYKEIRMRIDGAQQIYVNAFGQLVVKTSAGEILEAAPLAMQAGKPLVAKWVVQDDIVSIDVPDYDPAKELTIQSTLFFRGQGDPKL